MSNTKSAGAALLEMAKTVQIKNTNDMLGVALGTAPRRAIVAALGTGAGGDAENETEKSYVETLREKRQRVEDSIAEASDHEEFVARRTKLRVINAEIAAYERGIADATKK